MKKLFLILLIIPLSLMFSGCVKNMPTKEMFTKIDECKKQSLDVHYERDGFLDNFVVDIICIEYNEAYKNCLNGGGVPIENGWGSLKTCEFNN